MVFPMLHCCSFSGMVLFAQMLRDWKIASKSGLQVQLDSVYYDVHLMRAKTDPSDLCLHYINSNEQEFNIYWDLSMDVCEYEIGTGTLTDEKGNPIIARNKKRKKTQEENSREQAIERRQYIKNQRRLLAAAKAEETAAAEEKEASQNIVIAAVAQQFDNAAIAVSNGSSHGALSDANATYVRMSGACKSMNFSNYMNCNIKTLDEKRFMLIAMASLFVLEMTDTVRSAVRSAVDVNGQ